MGPSRGPLGAILEASGALLVLFWGSLGFLGPSWRLWGHLGGLLGSPGALLGPLGALLGALGAVSGPS